MKHCLGKGKKQCVLVLLPQDSEKAFAGFCRDVQHWASCKGLSTLVHVLWAARDREHDNWKLHATEVMLASLRSPPR